MRLDWLLDRFDSAAERAAFIHEDRTSLQEIAVPFQSQIKHCVEKWMPWADECGEGLPWLC